MSDTPRTDSLLASKTEPITAVKEFMRTIERELNIEKSEKLKYRERAWKAESQLDMRYGLRKEINEALGLTDETGDEALRKGLETIKALKAERDALLEARAWRPFSTAPKDGSEIMVWREDSGVFIALFTNSHVDDDDDDNYSGDPCWFSDSGEDLTGCLPTHWMPLPEPPKGVDP